MARATDVPADLVFVDPDETDATYRVCLFAAPGAGKSVAAASAPGPILVLSADRPNAYRFARKHHAPKVIREARYVDENSLASLFQHLRIEAEADAGVERTRTVVIDPVGNIIDDLRDRAPKADDGGIDHNWVNSKLLGFVQSLRRFDVNVVLVAHEKLNDGKRGDGKLYPAIGGGTLINKVLAELDICAHIERVEPQGDDGEVRWIGQLQPARNLVCKESTGVLGDRRIADLTRWFEVATEGLAVEHEQMPWEGGDEDAPDGDGTSPADDEQAAQDIVDAAKGQLDATEVTGK